MFFAIVGAITNIETIAIGGAIRELERLRENYGNGRWRKRKIIAMVRIGDDIYRKAELHWL
jgi:hypothetical protein